MQTLSELGQCRHCLSKGNADIVQVRVTQILSEFGLCGHCLSWGDADIV